MTSLVGRQSRTARRALLASLGLALLIGRADGATAAEAQTRVALVIGEGAYQGVPALANPPNDAADVAAALKSLGFQVTVGVDLDQAKMTQAIADFGKSAAAADVSLLYYGGHGLQVSQHNYLIPVDARFHSIDDIPKHTVLLDDALSVMNKGKGVRLVFLDACRNNPVKDASIPLKTGGLAKVNGATGFLIAFATQPDNVALDGAGRNSPFAQALLSHVAEPGASIASLMIKVRNDVIAATGGQQVPWDESSLTQQFFFAGEGQAGVSPETLLWQLAASQRDAHLLSIYLAQYPKGAHAADARALSLEIGDQGPKQPQTGGPEDELWALALSTRERSLVDLYLVRYPHGAHAEDARNLLSSLKAAESAARDPATECEKLATHPHDETANVQGVDFDTLAAHASAAIDACTAAVQAHPQLPHYLALLARAEAAAERYDEAVADYRKAADAGDGRAMTSLALLLEAGDHVPKDIKAAYALYEKAAQQGVADAAINLAVALYEGKTVPKDEKRAYALLKAAADQGSARATYDLAELVKGGFGDKSQDALALYRQAAELGEPKGFRGAAILLDQGIGRGKDPAGAAQSLLRCVASDDGQCLSELTGARQLWSIDCVKAMQATLKSASYYAGPIDGRSGANLSPALKQVRQFGLPKA